MKFLTAVNGLLALSSLIMLFFGLCNQVNESKTLLEQEQTLTLNNNSLIILAAVVAMAVFGYAFFAAWLKGGPVKVHSLRHRV